MKARAGRNIQTIICDPKQIPEYKRKRRHVLRTGRNKSIVKQIEHSFYTSNK